MGSTTTTARVRDRLGRLGVAAALVCLAATGMVGCGGGPGGLGAGRKAPAAVRRPLVVMRYFPYAECMVRGALEPLPDYSGWPDERMIRDFGRMSRAGVDVVLVAVTPGVSRDPRAPRYERLLDLVARHRDWPRVAFWLRPGDGSATGGEQVASWLGAVAARHASALYRADGRVLIVVAPESTGSTGRHPALTFRRAAAGEWGLWPRQPQQPVLASPDGTISVLFAGMAMRSGETNSLLGGRSRPADGLARTIRSALAAAPRILCIASWNDYGSGDVIEPNSRNEKRAMETMARELAKLSR